MVKMFLQESKSSSWSNTKLQSSIVLASYLAAWGYLLAILDAVYWDDWVFVGDPIAVNNHFLQAGAPWGTWFHTFFGYSPSTYRLITFFSFLVVSLCFLGILRRAPKFFQLSQTQILFASIVFATVPLNVARVSGNVVFYSLSAGFFFLAWYLWVRFDKSSITSSFVIFILFSLSFFTNSLLVFFAAPFLHKLALEGQNNKVQGLRALLFKGLIFGSLPFIWFAVFSLLKPRPFGFYAGYNSFLVTGPTIILGLILATLMCCLFWLFLKTQSDAESLRISRASASGVLSQFLLGLLLVALALFPYFVVGHFPPYTEWMTRDELLLPSGLGVLAAASFGGLNKLSYFLGKSFAIVVLLFSFLTTMFFGMWSVVDWSKQKVLLEYWGSSQAVSDAGLVIVSDKSHALNLFERKYRFYEWSGQVRVSAGSFGPYALGDSESDLAGLESGFLRDYSMLGSGPSPISPEDYLFVSITTNCDWPFEVLSLGIDNCISIEEKVVPFGD
jgi:hypothetical protein